MRVRAFLKRRCSACLLVSGFDTNDPRPTNDFAASAQKSPTTKLAAASALEAVAMAAAEAVARVAAARAAAARTAAMAAAAARAVRQERSR
jgi:hypothetical protein